MLPAAAVTDVDWRALGLVAALATFAAAAFCYIGLAVYFAMRADHVSAEMLPGAAPVLPAEAVPMPFNWLAPAAVATVLCFTPCAIASLVHASRVAPAYRAGHIEAARGSARLARLWFWWSFAIGVALVALAVALPWLVAALM